jgi:hypothetical protein
MSIVPEILVLSSSRPISVEPPVSHTFLTWCGVIALLSRFLAGIC